ncbi:MAG TPA: NADP-dependent phosphogluconate dehydrogenase [Syntrophales bacterium]|nr:NADP-dependent phosphogluconate dehydrogenase [Syntrophales bacterium]
MHQKKYDIGMIGLGVMGQNLLLNMADHGYAVSGYDRDTERVKSLLHPSLGRVIRGTETLQECMTVLKAPRVVMILVPAGPPVDAVIRELLPFCLPGDILIDCGNSHFTDTNLRQKTLARRGIHLLGVGISGGEQGARHGPSIMPGGPREAFIWVKSIFEAVAADVRGEPCVAYLGSGSVGHFVKMVHNGIEYAMMQLIAEAYDLMKRGLGLDDDELADVFGQWDGRTFHAYLLEITAHIFRQIDGKTGKRVIDVILDEAGQKGTGKWASQAAMDLHVPVPVIDAAVAMRDLSAFKAERETASRILAGPAAMLQEHKRRIIDQVEKALYAAIFIAYTQGMALLEAASSAYSYGLNLSEVARIWRGGCIIRSALLEEIWIGLKGRPDVPNLLLQPRLYSEAASRRDDLQTVVCTAATLGIPVPAMMAALAYYDGYRSTRLPANLIQAQRDYFGAHTYERVDQKGVFHTRWNDSEPRASNTASRGSNPWKP